MKHILFILALVSTAAFGQTRTMKLDADCVKIQDGVCIDKFELGYLDGVTSSLQTQISSSVSDTAYDATSWNGVLAVAPSKNAVRDQVEAILTSITAGVSDVAYNAGTWDGVTTVAPSKNAVRDEVETLITSIALKAPLASPAFSGNPTVPNQAAMDDSTKVANTAYVDAAVLAAGGGNVVGQASSVDSEIALFSGTGGKTIKRATGSGFAKLTSGVLSASANVNAATELTGIAPVANGGTGANTLTANNVILGNGTSAVQFVAPGTAGNVLTSNGTTWASSNPNSQVVFIYDSKAMGTNGGGCTSGAWRTRTLNSTDNLSAISGAALASNTITLTAGTYEIEGSAPGYLVDMHKTRLRNTTAGTNALIGTSERASGTVSTRSFIDGVVTIAGSTDFTLEHRCETTNATNGFGFEAGWEVEKYAEIKIRKLR